MAILTSTGAVNLTTSTNWSPAQIPANDDDLIIAGHTLTLDADKTFGTITFNNAASRLAVSGSPRTLTVTNEILFSTAAISATLITLTTGTLTIIGTHRSTITTAIYCYTVSGGTLVLEGTGGGTNTTLATATGNIQLRMVSLTSGTVTLRGRASFAAATAGQNFISVTGGDLTYTHTGTSVFYGTAASKLISITGSTSGTVAYTGDIITNVPASSTGIILSSNANVTLTHVGDILGIGSTAAGALLYCSAGIYDYTGNAYHIIGNNSLTVWIIGGTFRWKNQTTTIPASRACTLHATAGTLDIANLIINNSGVFVGLLITTAAYSSSGATLNNLTSTAIGGINHAVVTTNNYAESAPTLPDVTKVEAGEVYGYSGALTGTGIVAGQANIQSNVTSTLASRFDTLDALNVAAKSAAQGAQAKLQS